MLFEMKMNTGRINHVDGPEEKGNLDSIDAKFLTGAVKKKKSNGKNPGMEM